MDNGDARSGKRFEIVVLKIHRNNEDAMKELFALEEYFKGKGEKYSLLHASYGSPSKALKKTIAWYLDSYQLQHPVKTLYEINKMFIDKKMAKSIDIGDMGLHADLENLINGLTAAFGKTHPKPEDIDDEKV